MEQKLYLVLMFTSKFSVLIVVLGLSCGCSSMLYQPHNKQIYDPTRIGHSPSEVVIKTEDNEQIYAWYFKAKKPKGLILHFHGNAENLSSHFASLEWVVEQGYSFLIFDYRGYWKSTGVTSPFGTIKDGRAVLKWGAQESDQLKVPLVVFGQSLGGAVALRSVIESKKDVQPDLVIVESTFSSYKKAASSVIGNTWLWPFKWLSYLVMDDEWAPKGHLDQLSPIPLVVMHGTKDQVIDYELGESVFEQSRSPKEFWSVKDGLHINSFWMHKHKWKKKFLIKLKSIQK